jgi:hypothetical protein
MVVIRYAHVQIHPGSNAWQTFIFFCGVTYSDKCSGKQIDIKRNRLWSLLTFHIYTLFKINICYEINPWTNRKKEHRTKLTSANLLWTKMHPTFPLNESLWLKWNGIIHLIHFDADLVYYTVSILTIK